MVGSRRREADQTRVSRRRDATDIRLYLETRAWTWNFSISSRVHSSVRHGHNKIALEIFTQNIHALRLPNIRCTAAKYFVASLSYAVCQRVYSLHTSQPANSFSVSSCEFVANFNRESILSMEHLSCIPVHSLFCISPVG